ncbi:MAG: hypothetical protein RLZZ282_1451 [Verrucomicrobiota bacterium]
MNNLATTRQGTDFRRELGFDNASTQRWETVTTNGGSLLTSHHHIPAASTIPGYDLDGNLTSDGQWTYTWDADTRFLYYTNRWYDSNTGRWPSRDPIDYTNVKLDFGASEFIRSIPNGTAHFVGSGKGDAYTKEFDQKSCKIKSEFTITNTTSLKSAFYHLIPNSWNNTSTGTPGANWNQTYTWNEDFDCKN